MDLSRFLKRANLTSKEIALIDYFRTDGSVDKYNGDFSKLINAKQGYDIFTYEEIEDLLLVKETRDAVNCWRNIIAFILNIDLIGQKYYYQMVSAIHRSNIFENKEKKLIMIRESYFKFIENTFLAMTLNRIFKGLIEIQSPLLLIEIPFVEKEPSDYCLLLKNEYLSKIDILADKTKKTFIELTQFVKEDEYFSQSFISSAINSTDEMFKMSFRLLDFKTYSDTIGLKREGKKV